MAKHNELGKIGERMAADFLRQQGYTIHEADERMGHLGELDIIAFRGNEVVFVEVKTCTEADTDPMDVVPARTRARICRAADAFISNYNLMQLPRYDIIIVNIPPGEEPRLTHYPDAFYPPLT